MSTLTSNALSDRAETVRQLVAESDAAAVTSIEKALAAGHELVAAKAECKHGEWLPFLERAGVHERQARRLMQLAQSDLKSDTVSDLGGIKAALLFLSKRSKSTKLLKSIEFNGWADVLDRAMKEGHGHDGLTKHIKADVLERDMDRLMEAMLMMQDMHEMLTDKAEAA